MATGDAIPEEMIANDEDCTFEPDASPGEETTNLFEDEEWSSMLRSPCTFDTDIFNKVMLNLVKNPNIMSSHLFRADVFYDSQDDASTLQGPAQALSDGFTKHMKEDYRPRPYDVQGFDWQRTIVRQLVPRNRQLDKDLVQTCHFFSRTLDRCVQTLVIYIPHVSGEDEIPWYHPKVRQLAFTHIWQLEKTDNESKQGSIAVYFHPFSKSDASKRLERTALNLLSTIHKHGQGSKKGYIKRVHHDQIIPQQRFQDTYARLKAKYVTSLIGDWVEQTDPGKHVFEDLGIAAFLIELWADMYGQKGADDRRQGAQEAIAEGVPDDFPGFVDIGCGNGVLIHVLVSEGYHGWGFDARKRKTWATFPTHVQSCIKEKIMVPGVLWSASERKDDLKLFADLEIKLGRAIQDGDYGRGTFIISNHADELTSWTPLLAYLNDSPFIAIPCCSHNLAGARFRAPPRKDLSNADTPTTLPHEPEKGEANGHEHNGLVKISQAAETGSLKRLSNAKQMPSAYSTLCDYVTRLTEEVGLMAEKEMLRIPSTRNACIVGRSTAVTDMSAGMHALSVVQGTDRTGDVTHREDVVRAILVRELGQSLDSTRQDWVNRARQIAGKKGDGH